MTEKVNPGHVQRKAILYVRQSSTHQVLHNRESQRLQYAMREQLVRLGWGAVDVIDEDLGKSAGGGALRSGFQRMVAEVSLAQVGIVAARELSRFARNSREWQQLIEVCRIVDTLLMDEEAVYDARLSNDRLLLGVKGSLNEYELDLMRQRSQKARESKALRSQLGMSAPVGYVNAGEGRQEKDPDERVRQAIGTIFEKFLELGTARQVLMWLLDHGLTMPGVRYEGGKWTVCWHTPTYHAILRILKHPAYAGAYAWGKTRSELVLHEGSPRRVTKRRSRDQWHVLQRDHHEGYVTWEIYERIQEMIRKNVQANVPIHAGAAKRGSALLAGLLRCRRCGRKLQVRYKGRNGEVLRYVCHRGYEGSDEPRCIGVGGTPVDEAVAREVVRVIRPGAIEAAVRAGEEVFERQDQERRARQLALEAARYEADRARRQYDASDPENRLVAGELERRWNAALEQVAERERDLADVDQRRAESRPPPPGAFLALAEDVAAVWGDRRCDVRVKKRIIRALIEEVIVDVEGTIPESIITIHWKGGVHSQLRLARRRPGQRRQNVPTEVVEAVRLLSRVCSDERIAAWLTRNGLKTGQGNCWTRQHVTGLRHRHEIPVYDGVAPAAGGWMNLSQAAAYLGVDRVTLRVALERGEIGAVRPLPVGPWVLKRSDLDQEPARALAARVQDHRRCRGREGAETVSPCLFDTSRNGAL
jgi:DNA invertase Pin-like site-specific DNA recombinase